MQFAIICQVFLTRRHRSDL